MSQVSPAINWSVILSLLLFLLPAFVTAEIIRNSEQLERGESNISLLSDNTTSHVSDVLAVLMEEQLEIGERCRNVSNGILHSYNVQAIFSKKRLARRDVHLDATSINEIHSMIFPVAFIKWNYNSAMFMRLSGERCVIRYNSRTTQGQYIMSNNFREVSAFRIIFQITQ